MTRAGRSFLLATLLLVPSVAAGQTGGPPVPVDHWSYDFLEALDAAGVASAWMVGVRPASREAVRAELRRVVEHELGGGAVAEAWARRFDVEHPLGAGIPGDGRPGGVRFEVSVASGVVEGDGSALVNPGAGFFSEARVTARATPWLTGWMGVESGRRERLHRRSVDPGVSVGLGPFALVLARQRIRSPGPAETSSMLGGEVPLDALYLVSERPVVPGWLGWLTGPTSWQFALAPVVGVDSTGGGWVGSGGVVAEPHPRFRFGITRSARFGGPGLPGITGERLFRTVFLMENDPFFWDDQRMELYGRLRWSLFGQPLATYVVLAQEDTPLWKDPGILAGTTVPLLTSGGLFRLRYEYTAYGKRARWCPGCEYATGPQDNREQGEWYIHGGVGPYHVEGVPIGDPLGGYGAGHELEARFWSMGGTVQARTWAFFQVREPRNLLLERWPGKRRGGGAEATWHLAPGYDVTAGTQVAGGTGIPTDWAFWIEVAGVGAW